MISEIIEKWIKGILIDGITGNLSGLFDNVNAKVGEIASDVGSTPQAWNSGIFNMLRSLSETVVLPIAAAILALVMCHELIQMITEKNNMHDFDTSMFFRWIFKSALAILIVSNTWNIVMGVFDATQSVVNQSSGVIIGETSIHFDRLIPGLEFQLESMTIGSLLSLWFQTLVVGLTMNILSICIFLVTYELNTFQLVFRHRRHRPCRGSSGVYLCLSMRVGGISRRCAGKPLAGSAPFSGHHHCNKGGFL